MAQSSIACRLIASIERQSFAVNRLPLVCRTRGKRLFLSFLERYQTGDAPPGRCRITAFHGPEIERRHKKNHPAQSGIGAFNQPLAQDTGQESPTVFHEAYAAVATGTEVRYETISKCFIRFRTTLLWYGTSKPHQKGSVPYQSSHGHPLLQIRNRGRRLPRATPSPGTDGIREWRMRLALIPVGHARHVVAAFEQTGLIDANLLELDP